jgi:hypothetical protein
MRRYFFYLVVALLTFAVGKSVVFDKKHKTVSDSVVVNLQTENAVLAKPTENAEMSIEVKLTCSDKKLVPVWDYLKSELEKDYYFREVGTDCANFFEQKKFADLNGDGKKEKIIQGLSLAQCAPVGNCSFFIFEKVANQYQPILSESAGSAQQFEISKNKTNGYRHLILKSHGSWNSVNWNIYKFNGGRYEVKECYYYVYEEFINRKGKLKTRNKPTLTYHKCYSE